MGEAMIQHTQADPLVESALARMADEGPTWTTTDRDRWCEMFADIVAYVYPGRKPRKSRAKGAEEEAQQ